MPLTYFAHQGPFLPFARRWPNRIDGLTLMIGSMAPDFAYVLNGSRFTVWAHSYPAIIWFCVPVTLIVSWLVSSTLARVVPMHLPNLGRFNLHDYRGLANHHFRWPVAALSALLGAFSHSFLDMFTHDWGWFAQNVGWYRSSIVDGAIFGRRITFYGLMQQIGHVVFSGLAIALLGRYGSQRWMASRAATVPAMVPTPTTRLMLWLPTALLVGAALYWVYPLEYIAATDALRLSAAGFAGLLIGSGMILRSETISCHSD